MNYANKKEALAAGKRFLAKATAEGFTGLKLDVFENADWHVCLRGSFIQFWPDTNDKLLVLAGAVDGGRPAWSPTEVRFDSFKTAFDAVLGAADREVRLLTAMRTTIASHRPQGLFGRRKKR